MRQLAPPSTQSITYNCAPTTNMYFDYHIGHRKALEVSKLTVLNTMTGTVFIQYSRNHSGNDLVLSD